jgi:hypothetical protein
LASRQPWAIFVANKQDRDDRRRTQGRSDELDELKAMQTRPAGIL